MRILRLRLQSFRGVVDHEVVPSPSGVTVLVGENEVGKTSVVDALDLLLDEYDDSRKRLVRQTQPVGQDVATVVEAEIRAGRHRFTYRKQWHRQPSTRLVVHEPAPEQLAGREAHARVLEVLAEEVDLPLWRALRLQQGVGLEQAELDARSSLAQALDATVAESVGGEREETLVARAEAEHLRYSTPTGAVRVEGRQLLADVEAAQARVVALEREVAEVDRVVDRLDRAREDATAERSAGARDAADLRAAQERLLALRLVRRTAEVAAADLASATAQSATAQQGLAERSALRRRVQELVEAAQERATALVVAEGALAGAQERLETAGAAAEAAAVGAGRRRTERDAVVRAAGERAEEVAVERLRGVLAAHDQAVVVVAAAEADLAVRHVDEAALADVEELHRAWVEARGRAGASAPVLVLRGAGVVVTTADGERELGPDPEEVRLSGGTWFEVGGLRVEARPTGEQERAESSARRAADALAGRCAALGVPDLAGAAAAAHARRTAVAALDAAQGDLRRAAAGEDLGAARRRVARWDAARPTPPPGGGSAGPGDTGGPDDAGTLDLRQAESEAALSRAAAEETRTAARLEAAAAALEDHRRRVAEARADVEAAAARADLLAADLASARSGSGDDALGQVAETALALREAAQERLATAEAAVRDAGVEDAEADLAVLRDRVDDGRKRLRGLEDEVGALAAVLDDRGGAGTVEQLAQARADHDRLSRELAARERRASAARTLHEALQEARARAHAAYVQPLRAEVERLAAPVFGADVRVEVGPDLRVVSRTLDGVTVPYDQLSTGAREQLALLGRLACAVLVSGGAGVPVLVDDALGWSDERRLDGMARALSLAGASCQVLVLTCVPERYRKVTGATTVRLRA
ncbi:AAA family ATPase [Pseudokineococcus basanitobsidens]|uniref:AAA family ATPase n=1 Tax=Pseudokineococcus basanitobsidens TaxID=1926649 RepID=A0ABU8RIW7_9ACTN